MMDCWNSGIMGIKIGNNGFLFFFLLHHSSIPVGLFQTEISRKRMLRINYGALDGQIAKA